MIESRLRSLGVKALSEVIDSVRDTSRSLFLVFRRTTPTFKRSVTYKGPGRDDEGPSPENSFVRTRDLVTLPGRRDILLVTLQSTERRGSDPRLIFPSSSTLHRGTSDLSRRGPSYVRGPGRGKELKNHQLRQI